MDKLFITILNNTLVSSWIILAVIVIRFIFTKFIGKIPKWVNCLLWGLVAIRLVFPISIESIFSLIPSSKPVSIDIEYAEIPRIDSGITVVNTVINPILEDNFAANEVASVNPIQVAIGVVSYIWVIGVVAFLIYAIVSFVMLKKQVKKSQFVDKGIYRCGAIDSPFILGVFRPYVYIPDSLDEGASLCVIEHEKAHIKRGDFIWKPFGFVVLSVYWFNPLCWVAYILLCKDIEYACDEKVTKNKDKEWKAKYCQVLLDCSAQRRLISACPVAFGEVSVKDRIKSVINYKKPSFWIICISIITVIVLALCFMTNPKSKEMNNSFIVGKYVKSIAEEDKMLYASVLSINEDGTFVYNPSMISSYMGVGTWEVDKNRIVFSDTGMGDTRKEVFFYKDGCLFYDADDSASNSMWQLKEGDKYILAPDDFDLIKEASEELLRQMKEMQEEAAQEAALEAKAVDEAIAAQEAALAAANGFEDGTSKDAEDFEDENMGVSYEEDPITHDYIVEGDMVLKYKKVLEGQASDNQNPIRYIVLTNDDDITWEMVNQSLNSSNYQDQIYGTIIIGMKEMASENNGTSEVKVFWRG